jgi:hypothetical protein
MAAIIKSIVNGCFVISTSFMGWFLTFWFTQPSIEYFNDGYTQRIDSASFGTIYLINNGRGADEDVTITLDQLIEKRNITISYLTSAHEIRDDNNHTIIRIERVNPGEEAEITFKTTNYTEEFFILTFTSKSGNIIEVSDILLPWWKLSRFQFNLLISVLGIIGSGSFILGSRYKKKKNGKKNKSS